MMVDTQVISRSFKNADDVCRSARICSVVANEFLETCSDSLSQPRYFIPLLPRLSKAFLDCRVPRDHPPQPGLSDRIVIDFNNRFPSLVDHSSRAVPIVLNYRNDFAYKWAISGLPKSEQKRLYKRFLFLCETISECVPLDESTAAIAVDLLSEFSEEHAIKRRFRDSFNDLLILAAAMNSGDALRTEDSLLARFAASRTGVIPKVERKDIIIDFGTPSRSRKRPSGESKQYINRGWRIAFENAFKIRLKSKNMCGERRTGQFSGR
jgi:hypothetical protein